MKHDKKARCDWTVRPELQDGGTRSLKAGVHRGGVAHRVLTYTNPRNRLVYLGYLRIRTSLVLSPKFL